MLCTSDVVVVRCSTYNETWPAECLQHPRGQSYMAHHCAESGCIYRWSTAVPDQSVLYSDATVPIAKCQQEREQCWTASALLR